MSVYNCHQDARETCTFGFRRVLPVYVCVVYSSPAQVTASIGGRCEMGLMLPRWWWNRNDRRIYKEARAIPHNKQPGFGHCKLQEAAGQGRAGQAALVTTLTFPRDAREKGKEGRRGELQLHAHFYKLARGRRRLQEHCVVYLLLWNTKTKKRRELDRPTDRPTDPFHIVIVRHPATLFVLLSLLCHSVFG